MNNLDVLVQMSKHKETVAAFVRSLAKEEKAQVILVQRLFLNGHIVSPAYDELSDLQWTRDK